MTSRGSSSAIRVAAPAKVNLFLRVYEVRPDGFHGLETLFQAIDLADDVVVERHGKGVELEVRGADLGAAKDNLAFRAATRLLQETGSDAGLRVELTKRIPVGAGLGGGSSDAAAVLKAGGRLLGVPTSEPLLARLGAELGSDVPFFLGASPLAVGRGRGELLEPVPPLPTADLVLVTPPVHVSTAWAYRALDTARESGAGERGPPLPGQPGDWEDVAAHAHNDFQTVVAASHAEISRALTALERSGARVSLMSGSGSASFALFGDRGSAERAAAALSSELGWPCTPARTLTQLPAPEPA